MSKLSGDNWPVEYMPKDFPQYPEGTIEVLAAPGDVVITIKDTSRPVMTQYLATLNAGGWEHMPYSEDFGVVYKGNWMVQYTWAEGDLRLSAQSEG